MYRSSRSCRRYLVTFSKGWRLKCGLLVLVILFVFGIYLYFWSKTSENHAQMKDFSAYQQFDYIEPQRKSIPSGINLFKEYCNSPFVSPTGSEGKTHGGFTLRMVHIFIRHGDRTPIHDIPNYTPGKLSCHFESWYNGSDQILKQFPLRMRQMRRNQTVIGNFFFNWPLLPQERTCADGSLTSRGALQHLKLGRHLLKAYWKLLNLTLPIVNQVSVKCTPTKRTYQSAIALLYGFIPDFHLSNVNIEHSPSLYFCNRSTLSEHTCLCNHAEEMKIGYRRFEQLIHSKSKNVTRIYRQISQLFNIELSAHSKLPSVADTLAPEFCHNSAKLSEVFDQNHDLQHKLISDIWTEMAEQKFEHLNDGGRHLALFSNIIFLPALRDIVERMNDLTQGLRTPKIVLYSGHDLTLTSLLFVLGLYDGIWPPYASRVVFELYEVDALNTDRYFLKFLYNGLDVTKDVIFCQNVTYYGLCNLKYFKKFVLNTMIQQFGYTNYVKACKS